MTAADLKAFFDGRTDKEVKDSINGIVDDLVSTTDGASGADNIGATPLKLGGATKVQGQLEEISTTLDEHKENNEHVKAQVGAPTGQAIGALWFQDLGDLGTEGGLIIKNALISANEIGDISLFWFDI